MTPGPSEEIGKVAVSIVDSLRSQPLMLALILVNVLFMTLVFFSVRDTREKYHEMLKLLTEQNAKAQELLSRCVVPQKLGDKHDAGIRLDQGKEAPQGGNAKPENR